VLSDVVDDLLELAVELEGLGDEAVMGAAHGHGGAGPSGDHDDVMRRKAHDDSLNLPALLLDVDREEASRDFVALLID
jgi:hypothetical protein